MRRQKTAIRMVLLIGILCATYGSVYAAGNYQSPEALAATSDGKTIYIGLATGEAVAVFDVAKEKIVKTISLPGVVGGAVLSKNGAKLYVTEAVADGKVHVVDTKSGKVIASFAAGHTPVAPILSKDGKTLYVCNRFDNDVQVLDAKSGKSLAKINVTREPTGAALTPDGSKLIVTNLLIEGASDSNFASAVVSIIDTKSNKVIKSISLLNGCASLRGVYITKDGKFAYIAHILSRFLLPTTQLERGWMNTNALSIINIKKLELLNTVLLDSVDLGAANPWALTCTADEEYICVTHAGTHEVSVIDRAALHAKLGRLAKGEKVSETSQTPEDVPNDLSFLVDLRRRIKLTGSGPRDIVVIGSKVYTAEYFSDSIGIVDIDPDAVPRPVSIAIGKKQEMTQARRGEMLFHDADMCFQKWQSCSSCHPSSGRPDSLNWDLLNDGIGNPKNTKSLLYAHSTPPAMVTGIRENAEMAVRAGIKFIQFATRPENDAAAIDEYLKALRPVASPYLVDGKLSAAAERGKKLFDEATCSSCHFDDYYTDMEKHDIGTGKGMEEDQEFDTPSLVEIWRTGPYLYDGRAATIEEVLTKYNADDMHGFTSDLSEKQIADLVEYILSL
jgi:YVTN family beta-propeller protein